MWPQSDAKAGPGRAQLLIQAFQASNRLSCWKPGSSSHGAGTQRLRWAGKVPEGQGTGGAVAAGGRAGIDGVAAVGGVGAEGSGSGRVAHAASIPTIASVVATRRSLLIMGLILLEALLALVVLVAIVWWTMFSGREGGEPPKNEPDDTENPKSPPP